MSWLLFLDESGHDHRTMPYEVHGGIALHATKLWPFIQAIRSLELSTFGAHLNEHGSEVKGSKLLARDRFKWASQGPAMEHLTRRKQALAFLNSAAQGKTPRREEFTAFGQACLSFAKDILLLLSSHDARLFASMIPCVAPPMETRADVPRKDIVFLLERYFYFLRDRSEMGLLVMDRTEKDNDRKLVRRMERYFIETVTGAQRSQFVVPSPLFVESDMAYGVQVADLCIYCLNWAYRFNVRMTEAVRSEISDFVGLLEPLIWQAEVESTGKRFRTHSVVYVPDPYTARSGNGTGQR